MTGHEAFEQVRTLIDHVAMGIEILAVVVIVAGVIIVATSRGTIRLVFQGGKPGAYQRYVDVLGRPLLMGLDLMVAGDLVRTVALELNLANIGALGLLVLVRTFLSWALVVEMEGHWPWQTGTGKDNQGGSAQTGGSINKT